MIIYEYARIFLYTFGTYALLHLALIFPKLRLTLISFAAYFSMWGTLLIVQINHQEQYRHISNIVSTPALLLIVILIYANIYEARRE